MPLQRPAYLKNRLFSVSIEWHSRLLLLTSVVFTTLVQWIGALQKNTPSPLGRACSLQEVRCKGTAKESPGMTAGSTTGSATERSVSAFRQGLPPEVWLPEQEEDRLCQNLLSGADGLSSLSSIGVSSLFFTMSAERTVITFRALPSIVTAKTTRTGGSEENCETDREVKEQNGDSEKTHKLQQYQPECLHQSILLLL